MSFYRYCPKCGDITCSQKEEKCDFCNESYITTDYEWSSGGSERKKSSKNM